MTTRENAQVTVGIVDDHPIVRDGLKALLGSVPGVRVIGEAATGREAVRLAVTLKPQVIVMDLQMPDLDGVTATREIARVAPGVAVLVLTTFDDDENVAEALRAGARGYLLKGAPQDEIVRAIASVASGGAVFGSAIASGVLDRMANRSPDAPAPFPSLTPREREVLHLLTRGLPTGDIAAALGLSGKTVGNHLSAIFAKLGVEGRSQAIVTARDAGLGRH